MSEINWVQIFAFFVGSFLGSFTGSIVYGFLKERKGASTGRRLR